jgi:hypothetical protein
MGTLVERKGLGSENRVTHPSLAQLVGDLGDFLTLVVVSCGCKTNSHNLGGLEQWKCLLHISETWVSNSEMWAVMLPRMAPGRLLPALLVILFVAVSLQSLPLSSRGCLLCVSSPHLS